MRDAMRDAGVSALLVPSSDPHLSEYLPGRWQARQWLSGFTGSMATLVITHDEAALFADSRYWTQAEAELAGSAIELVRIPTGSATHHLDWLAARLAAGAVVAVDGDVLGLAAADALRRAVEAGGAKLRTDIDLLQAAWPDRPDLPAAPVWEHRAPHAILSRAAKLEQVRQAMAAHGATHHLVSTLDDIAWLFNLRGADVSYNPVFLAHALIDAGRAVLFVGSGKVSPDLAQALRQDGVELAGYMSIGDALAALPPTATVLLDPRRVTLGLRERIAAHARVVEAINPSTLAKSRKSEPEIEQIRTTMAHDGAALCEFYAWFEAALADPAQRGRITELTVDRELLACRSRRPGFIGPSFSTIAGFGANGAMPHYRATEQSHAVIDVADGPGTLLLIDSGGQYLGGTTDITRVWPIGEPTAAQRRDYTLVLKGTLALSRTRFPRGTLSPMLDAIARAPLWQHGLDFGHGTGHGVGYCLNVHEGPQSISRATPEPAMAMQPGMVTSIEPGVYRPGQWGVRIENLVVNVATDMPDVADFGEFLEFETLTLCPIDTHCLDLSLLRADEIDWLDRYHATVRERIAPLVDGAALEWLLRRTQPI